MTKHTLPRHILEKFQPHPANVNTKAKSKKRKWVWYKPVSFAAHGRMTDNERSRMDREYRDRFGNDRGGQKAERAGKYNRNFLIAEYNIKDDVV